MSIARYVRDHIARLSARDRRALRFGLAVVVPALFWVFMAKPYINALADVRDRLSAERGLLAREEELLAAAPSLPDEIIAAEVEAVRANDRLVVAANPPLAEARITEWLEQIAGLSRVLLLEMSAEDVAREEIEPGALEPIRLIVNGESDLEGVMTFLLRVEESPLLLRVRELLVEPQVERPRSSRRRDDDEPVEPGLTGVVRFTLVVEAYAPEVEPS
ncbi:MAG: hypothetical protein ACREL7_16490 [Longimicrobiales bacterium]